MFVREATTTPPTTVASTNCRFVVNPIEKELLRTEILLDVDAYHNAVRLKLWLIFVTQTWNESPLVSVLLVPMKMFV